MIKKTIFRGLLGFPLGIALGYLITIVLSLIWGKGYYSPCVPQLISVTGSEISAVVLQAALCGLLGTGFAASSVIWEMENLSLLKQTAIYFITVSMIMMPVAYFTCWMEHSAVGFISYFVIFTAIFAIVWTIRFLAGKRTVDTLNKMLHNKKRN